MDRSEADGSPSGRPEPIQGSSRADPQLPHGQAVLLDLILGWLWGYDVFISYAWRDGEETARHLERALVARGLRVHRDEVERQVGEELERAVAGAIRRSICLLYVCTAESANSAWVRAEVDYAVRAKRSVVPLVCGEIPSTLEGVLKEVVDRRLGEQRVQAPYVDEKVITKVVVSIGAFRQGRRRAAALSIFAGLLALLALGLWFAFTAAKRAERVTEAQRLAAKSAVADLRERPLEAALLAIEAVRATVDWSEPPTQEAESQLRTVLAELGGLGWAASNAPVKGIWEGEGGRIVVLDANGSASGWDVTNGVPRSRTPIWKSPLPIVRHVEAEGERGWPLLFDASAVSHTFGVGGADETVHFKELDPRAPLALGGGRLVQASGGFLRVWSRLRGTPIDTVELGGEAEILSVDRSGTYVAVRVDGQVEVRDLRASSAPVVERLGWGLTSPAVWSSDGRRLALSCGDGCVVLYGLDSGRVSELRYGDEAVNNEVVAIAFSGDGQRLAVLTGLGSLTLWDAEPATVSAPTWSDIVFQEPVTPVLQEEAVLMFVAEGSQILAAAGARQVSVISTWRPDVVRTLWQSWSRDGDGSMGPVPHDADGDLLLLGRGAGGVDAWQPFGDSPTDFQRVAVLRGHDGGSTVVRGLRDGSILTGGQDGTLRHWPKDGETRYGIAWRTVPIELSEGAGWSGSSPAIAVGEDGKGLVEGRASNVQRFRVHPPEPSEVYSLVGGLWVSRDGRWGITGKPGEWTVHRLGAGASGRLFDVFGPSEVVAMDEEGRSVLVKRPSGIEAVDVDSEGFTFHGVRPPDANARPQDVARRTVLWRLGSDWLVTDRVSGGLVRRFAAVGETAVFCLSDTAVCGDDWIQGLAGFPPLLALEPGTERLQDGSRCIATQTDSHLVVVAKGGVPRTFEITGGTALSCDPATGRFVVGTRDGALKLEAADGSVETIELDNGPIRDIARLPDGRFIVVGATTMVIDTTGGTLRRVDLWSDDKAARAVAGSADGRWLAVAGEDGILRLHPGRIEDLLSLAVLAVGRDLSLAEWGRTFQGRPWRSTTSLER